MHACVAIEPFKIQRKLPNLLCDRICVDKFLQLRLGVVSLLERDAELIGDQLRHLIGLRKRHIADASHIADDAAREQLTEGRNLRDVVFAVLIDDVVDHLASARLAKIHVDVGHRDTRRI